MFRDVDVVKHPMSKSRGITAHVIKKILFAYNRKPTENVALVGIHKTFFLSGLSSIIRGKDHIAECSSGSSSAS